MLNETIKKEIFEEIFTTDYKRGFGEQVYIAYHEAIANGLSEKEAMEFADKEAREVMGRNAQDQHKYVDELVNRIWDIVNK